MYTTGRTRNAWASRRMVRFSESLFSRARVGLPYGGMPARRSRQLPTAVLSRNSVNEERSGRPVRSWDSLMCFC